ncbi:MAG: amino acid racemase [Caulobacteraceae bacterium]|nr:amino acid racemase [Caulobacter sp.]
MGGMGPAATVDFLDRVRRRTPARADADHLRLLVDSDPTLPDRHAAVAGRGDSPGPRLAAMAQGLERAGAEGLALVCNSAHAWADEIRAAVSIPFIDMVAETAAALARRHPGVRRPGLLAAGACLDARLYERAFAPLGLSPIAPTGELRARFMALLARIKGGDTGEAAQADMRALADALLAQGADAVVAGCTEVPLVLGEADVGAPFVDSTAVLADRAVAFGLGAWSPGAG